MRRLFSWWVQIGPIKIVKVYSIYLLLGKGKKVLQWNHHQNFVFGSCSLHWACGYLLYVVKFLRDTLLTFRLETYHSNTLSFFIHRPNCIFQLSIAVFIRLYYIYLNIYLPFIDIKVNVIDSHIVSDRGWWSLRFGKVCIFLSQLKWKKYVFNLSKGSGVIACLDFVRITTL